MTEMALSYLPIEIKSYLPSGWSLPEDPTGQWDARRGAWTVTVFDVADQDWKLSVKAADAGRLGRLEALRRAMGTLYREGLGKYS